MQNLEHKKEWNPLHYKCKLCNDEIWSKWQGQFVTCKCGAISVDQTSHYSRFIGEYENFIDVNKEAIIDK